MIGNHKSTKWVAGTARCEGNAESPSPSWVVSALKGRQRIDLVTGPLATRDVGESIARALNDTDAELWDVFIERHIPSILAGGWG